MGVWRMLLLLVLSAVVLCGCAQYSSDQCSWTGSGLTHESHARDVEQVYLRCAEGSLQWLYPTGAIMVNLRPNLPSSADLRVCVKPRRDSRGATVLLERAGALRVLLSEEEQAAGRVRCFSLQEGALFLEASVQRDISRRITAFQYQLSYAHTADRHTDSCRPCADEELLLSVCTSDFVARGRISRVEDNDEDEDEDGVSVVLSVSRVYRQKSRIFVSAGGGRGRDRWTGRVQILQRCDPQAGPTEFLFTGALRFGDAWLGCAPLYTDFLRVYQAARDAGTNPCTINTD